MVSLVAARNTSCTIFLSTWTGAIRARSSTQVAMLSGVTLRGDRNDRRVFMQNFKSWYLMCGSADAHLFDVLADEAAFASHVFLNVLQCAHWGAHDAEALYLDHIKVVCKHGAEDLQGARLVSIDTVKDELVCAFFRDA
jgi:hypothetical protein